MSASWHVVKAVVRKMHTHRCIDQSLFPLIILEYERQTSWKHGFSSPLKHCSWALSLNDHLCILTHKFKSSVLSLSELSSYLTLGHSL